MQPVSRRRFLSTTAALCAAPTFVPRSALGSETVAAPSERIRIGLIGCGKMANDYHIPSLLAQPDTQVVAVCEVDRTRREHAKRRVETYYQEHDRAAACDTYNDFRELLARDDVDAVCIATTDS